MNPKEKLETDIVRAITDFEIFTGVEILSIQIDRKKIINPNTGVRSIETDFEFKIK